MKRLTISADACIETLALLISMAWADGRLDDNEKAGVRAASEVFNLTKELRDRLDQILQKPMPVDDSSANKVSTSVSSPGWRTRPRMAPSMGWLRRVSRRGALRSASTCWLPSASPRNTMAAAATGARFEDMGSRKPSTIPEPTRTLLLNATEGSLLPSSIGDAGIELWALCGRKAGDDATRETAQNELRQKEFDVLARVVAAIGRVTTESQFTDDAFEYRLRIEPAVDAGRP